VKRYFLPICFASFAFAFAVCWAQQNSSEREPLSPSNWESKLREGDIVFIRSRSGNASLIAKLSNIEATDDTGKPGDETFERADRVFTHCGIVFRKNGEWMVYEGAGRGKFYR
jgi:hypothetical protein